MEVDDTYVQRYFCILLCHPSSFSRRATSSMSTVGGSLGPKAALLLPLYPLGFTLVAGTVGRNIQHDLTSVGHERDYSVGCSWIYRPSCGAL